MATKAPAKKKPATKKAATKKTAAIAAKPAPSTPLCLRTEMGMSNEDSSGQFMIAMYYDIGAVGVKAVPVETSEEADIILHWRSAPTEAHATGRLFYNLAICPDEAYSHYTANGLSKAAPASLRQDIIEAIKLQWPRLVLLERGPVCVAAVEFVAHQKAGQPA